MMSVLVDWMYVAFDGQEYYAFTDYKTREMYIDLELGGKAQKLSMKCRLDEVTGRCTAEQFTEAEMNFIC